MLILIMPLLRPTALTLVIMFVLRSFSSTALGASLKTAGDFGCTFRLATKGDIPSITSCNVMSLPENYSREYYKRHMKSWSTLAVVAENDDNKLIGYALGRVEAVDKSEVPSGFCGHVASIAVLEDYRGQGVGRDMMKMLHSQFVNVHNVNSVSLHCRISNERAINLYLNLYKYKFIREIKEYYDDGEDAVLMRVDDLKGELLETLE